RVSAQAVSPGAPRWSSTYSTATLCWPPTAARWWPKLPRRHSLAWPGARSGVANAGGCFVAVEPIRVIDGQPLAEAELDGHGRDRREAGDRRQARIVAVTPGNQQHLRAAPCEDPSRLVSQRVAAISRRQCEHESSGVDPCHHRSRGFARLSAFR